MTTGRCENRCPRRTGVHGTAISNSTKGWGYSCSGLSTLIDFQMICRDDEHEKQGYDKRTNDKKIPSCRMVAYFLFFGSLYFLFHTPAILLQQQTFSAQEAPWRLHHFPLDAILAIRLRCFYTRAPSILL